MAVPTWLESDQNVFISSPYSLAIAIKKIASDRFHIGILYKNLKNELQVLHFAFHHDLRNERLDNSYHWVNIRLNRTRAKGVVYQCELIASKKAKIPYGITYKGGQINKSGYYSSALNEVGLTCTTFILAVFEAQVGIKLVDWQSWESRPEDTQFVNHMVSAMRERNKKNTNPTIPEAHIKSVEEDICIRIRPEELTASAKFSIAELPVDFLKVQLPASEIKAALL